MCDDLPSACLHTIHGDSAKEWKTFGETEHMLSCLFQGLPDMDVTDGQHQHSAQVGDCEAVGTDGHQERDADHRRPPVLVSGMTPRGLRDGDGRHQADSPCTAATISARWPGWLVPGMGAM